MAASALRRAVDYTSLARQARKMRKAASPELAHIARQHLVRKMGQMRGLPQKLGQMLSFSADREASDPLAAQDYAELQQQAEPLPLESVVPVLEEAWGKPLDQVLEAISPHGHAASLGQVHQAVLKDGQEVAIKVQYPGIRESLHADLKLLGWLSVPVGNLRKGFDLAAYREMILVDLEEELDYLREARMQTWFANWAADHPHLEVPKVLTELSTKNVLVTEWASGETWSEVQTHWNTESKAELARRMIQIFFAMLFEHGRLHADLHPGNVRFRQTSTGPQLLLYDFGCVFQPKVDQQLALLRLIRATHLENESPLPLFLKLGFKREYLEPLADKLPALCRVLFEPFCAEYPYDIHDWRLGARVSDILGDDRLNFRIAGPPELVWLMRAFHGLTYYLRGLNAPVNWNRALEWHLLADGRQMDALAVPRVDAQVSDFTTLAKHLKIQVKEHGQTKVQLTSDARSIDDLSELLEPALRYKIEQRGIQLSSITADIRRRGYAPGPVFNLTEAHKDITVWLE